jgi:hypothetical protein
MRPQPGSWLYESLAGPQLPHINGRAVFAQAYEIVAKVEAETREKLQEVM